MVTVIVLTYNHERFIREAVDSVLAQETTFPFEVVIIEDCSTDRTRELIAGYPLAYPQKVRLVLEEVNKNDNTAFMHSVSISGAPYLAVLDGDDYWVSKHKLQRQVEYLENHPECSMCFHNVRVIVDDGCRAPRNSQPDNQKEVSTLDDLLEGCFVYTCSALMRRSAVRLPPWYVDDLSSDWSLFLLAAQHGNIGYLNEVMAVYRQHPHGMWTGQSTLAQQSLIAEYYAGLPARLPATSTGRIRTLQARALCELAREHERLGDLAAAENCLKRASEVEPDPRRLTWSLRVAAGGVATLVYPPDDPDALRIAIEETGVAIWDIQLNRLHIKVRREHRYMLTFRARADEARPLSIGVSEGHEPWGGLGLYRTVALTSEWKLFDENFVGLGDDDNGRIHFDAGESRISLEVASVMLRDCTAADGDALPPRGSA